MANCNFDVIQCFIFLGLWQLREKMEAPKKVRRVCFGINGPKLLHYEEKNPKVTTFRCWGHGGHQNKAWFSKNLLSWLTCSQIWLINVVDFHQSTYWFEIPDKIEIKNPDVIYATIRHHILYIIMDETTKFTSHMCQELQLFVWEKPHSLVGSTPPHNTWMSRHILYRERRICCNSHANTMSMIEYAMHEASSSSPYNFSWCVPWSHCHPCHRERVI
jgi:hypothetical protein